MTEATDTSKLEFDFDQLSRKSATAYVGHAREPEFVLEGWMLTPVESPATGLRAVVDGVVNVARRKQLRPDVMRTFPERHDALHSGFKITLNLRGGWNRISLQTKNAEGSWEEFCECRVKLSRLWRLHQRLGLGRVKNSYENWHATRHACSPEKLRAQREASDAWQNQPSFVLVLNSGEAQAVRRTLESLKAQSFQHWKLWIEASNASLQSEMKKSIQSDSRIGVGPCEHLSEGFIARIDPGDVLVPDALFEMAEVIRAHPEVALLFSDEDVIDERGGLAHPSFRMGVNLELLLEHNGLGHLVFFKGALLAGAPEGPWETAWKCLRDLPRSSLHHIARVLLHRASTAKDEDTDRVRAAIIEHLAKASPQARLEMLGTDRWRIHWPLPETLPKVSIIMPTRNRLDLVRVSVESLFRVTDYPNFELVIVNHASDEPDILAYFDEIQRLHPTTRIPKVEGPFNWAKLNNIGVAESSGDVVLFLNNDVEITNPGWLREMVSQAVRPDVGAVGACLFFPEGSLQHAGVVLNLAGIAGHVFRRARLEADSIGGPSRFAREVTAVTGACMSIRKDLFLKAGGFDQERLPISYNDIDFCLRLRSLGYRNIYTPHASMIHHESVSRAELEKQSARKDAATEEARVVLSNWPEEFKQDVFFNPNLSRDHEWPTLI